MGHRDIVQRLVLEGREAESLEIARGIRDPWYRCQALCSVADAHVGKGKLQLVDEAFASANEIEDLQRRVTVSAWPLGVLARVPTLIDETRYMSELQRLLALHRKVESPVRRADALATLLRFIPGDRKVAITIVAEALISAAATPLANGKRNRKGQNILSWFAPTFRRLDERLFQRALAVIEGPGHRRRAEGLDSP